MLPPHLAISKLSFGSRVVFSEVAMKFLGFFLIVWAVVFSAVSPAQVYVEGSSLPNPPGLPEGVEPDVTIIERDDDVIVEYRVEGQLYMVKIVPRFGASYFLLDLDGDGVLDVQSEDKPDLNVPQWLLFSW